MSIVMSKPKKPLHPVDLHERVEEALFGSEKLLPVTRSLVSRLLLDLSLTPAATVDFGVDSDDHYRALKNVVFNALEVGSAVELGKELDQACGNGLRLEALVRKYAPVWADVVTFSIPYKGPLS